MVSAHRSKRFPAALLAALAIWVGANLSEAAATTASAPCGTPAAAEDWPTGAPGDVGLDAARLCALGEMLDTSPDINVHAVLVVRHGKLVYETYRSGVDERWGWPAGVVAHTPQMKHDLRSVSKSVTSLLVGIALDRKLIGDVDQPVFAFFPDLAALRTPEKDRITLRNLLTMASGLAWNEDRPYDRPANDDSRMNYSTNPYRFTLEKPVSEKPGAKWNYSGGDTQLLAGVLQRRTGKFIGDFAKEALFEPLGIRDFEWVKMPGNGETAAASGLRLRPRDMAKIGELVLRRGLWNGRRVISQGWIDESTRTYMRNFDSFASIGYGYQWWTDYEEKGGRRSSWIYAVGLGGQRIYIHPEFDLVVVITAGFYAEDRQDFLPYDIFDKYVIAAIRP
ncbi:serine hydrolase [Nordella sp. HKS 07]|uniref:serine hydrolase domain-containing protein n=1 Tax=Nordella sp. HKS 07 TaxID=2712222 RepID=UPI0013E16214|nr:serine hydrolase [Nordella sp. HKS 07]QIG47851.1 serine hydrolase [Nordella sp. HKS 07]